MDVVYVIGTGSRWDNNELRYSLRSIERFGIGLGEVWIVGDELPDFIDAGKVRYLHFPDSRNRSPYQNVFSKIAYFFGATTVQRFLLSSDDHFFIKPTDFENYPIYYKGEHMPKEPKPEIGDALYNRVLLRTAAFMRQHNLTDKFFEGHTNKLYSRAAWDYLQALGIEEYAMQGDGISLNAPMAAVQAECIKPEYLIKRKDIKLQHLNTPEDWEQIREANCFSIGNSAIPTGVAGLLHVLFPNPSRFEK